MSDENTDQEEFENRRKEIYALLEELYTLQRFLNPEVDLKIYHQEDYEGYTLVNGSWMTSGQIRGC
jgi:hypothetical protein